MPIDLVEVDRNRVIGALVAYLRGVVTINAVYGVVFIVLCVIAGSVLVAV